MDKHLTEENCPQCGSKLNPPLKSGRQICSNCGWTNKPKQAIEVMLEKTDDGNSISEKEEQSNKTVINYFQARTRLEIAIIGAVVGVGLGLISYAAHSNDKAETDTAPESTTTFDGSKSTTTIPSQNCSVTYDHVTDRVKSDCDWDAITKALKK
jgi:ribosomal protein S27AE